VPHALGEDPPPVDRAEGAPVRPSGGAGGSVVRQPETAAGIDISDLIPVARAVAGELGPRLSRDTLIEGIRAHGRSVGGRRRKTIYAFILRERQHHESVAL
jgi:hypothetical protein